MSGILPSGSTLVQAFLSYKKGGVLLSIKRAFSQFVQRLKLTE